MKKIVYLLIASASSFLYSKKPDQCVIPKKIRISFFCRVLWFQKSAEMKALYLPGI